MDRKEFIKQCGFVCLGGATISVLAQSCSSVKTISSPVHDNQMQVALSAFSTKAKDHYKRYVVARNEQLNYPIVIYRSAEGDYTALLLRCSHQYNELNVNGELLTCPAHGSEFDSKGNVVTGPADAQLRSFPITKDNENLYIQLA